MKRWTICQLDGERKLLTGIDRFWALEIYHAWNQQNPEHRYGVKQEGR